MLLTPLSGADRQSLLNLLQERANEAENLRNRLDQLPPFQTFYQYLERRSRRSTSTSNGRDSAFKR